MPSMVTLVSAMFVARTTLRTPCGGRSKTRSCASTGSDAWRGSTIHLPLAAACACSGSISRSISSTPETKTRASPRSAAGYSASMRPSTRSRRGALSSSLARDLSIRCGPPCSAPPPPAPSASHASASACRASRPLGASAFDVTYRTSIGCVRPGTCSTGAPPKKAESASSSSVALISTSRSEGRRGSRRRSRPRRRSVDECRSWTSSSSTASHSLRSGSDSSWRSSTPSVTKRSRVPPERTPSKRTWWPTSAPLRQCDSSETRRASETAARRRGCVHTTLPKPAESSSRGTCVDFPHPVAPTTRRTCPLRKWSRSWGAYRVTGRAARSAALWRRAARLFFCAKSSCM
mmetsp:Transcript_36396/g.121894  ORF Transcript_36396/g.121894 Transcript_36396/m.121894 type:complete len:348 (-) Transcript_36396:241-1284(-)